MNLVWAAAGAVVGLPVGTALRGPVFGLSVRRGEPDRTSCQQCAAPVSGYTPIRCEYCGHWLVAPIALELITATVLAVLAGRFAGQPELAAFAFLGTVGVGLAMIDIDVLRLPDRLTLPAYPAIVALLALAAAADDAPGALAEALIGGLVLAGGYLLLALLSAGQVGGGDVKLAGLVGMALGWLGGRTVFIGASLAFALAAVVGLALLASRKATLRSSIGFGPYLLGGALVAILISGQ